MQVFHEETTNTEIYRRTCEPLVDYVFKQVIVIVIVMVMRMGMVMRRQALFLQLMRIKTKDV
jgi:hypothetical protein